MKFDVVYKKPFEAAKSCKIGYATIRKLVGGFVDSFHLKDELYLIFSSESYDDRPNVMAQFNGCNYIFTGPVCIIAKERVKVRSLHGSEELFAKQWLDTRDISLLED